MSHIARLVLHVHDKLESVISIVTIIIVIIITDILLYIILRWCCTDSGSRGLCPEPGAGWPLCKDDRHLHGHPPRDWRGCTSSSTVSTLVQRLTDTA